MSPRNTGMVTPKSKGFSGSNLSLSSTKTCCSRLRVGERVAASSTMGVKNGILRFLGETDFAKGEWAGIELDEPVGKNDGSVAGKRYFNCPMKFGLFAPVHKVSRAGGTATPRPPSVRGTPIMRSTSRDSLCSSVSTSSKASRVKLGVTSLTSSQQKARNTGGMGIMTTSRALEEALKEKDQHIEQLLKEHDIERGEIAKTASRCAEAETKYFDLMEKHEAFESERKSLENQISADKRKLEDLQFQLEEENIHRSDLEMQLETNTQILKRLENFLTVKMDPQFINVREILDGKENLTELTVGDNVDSQTILFKEKMAALEGELKMATDEKKKALEECQNLKSELNDGNIAREGLLKSLNISIQDKDDVISSLKTELNAQVEKLTKIIEENNNLTLQMELQATEVKGKSDSVVKEFGEKIKSLSDELNTKTSLLQEHKTSIEEKDSKISSLDQQLKSQVQFISEIQKQNQILTDDLEKKTTELIGKLELQKSTEEQFSCAKTLNESELLIKEEKILSLVKEIENLSSALQEKDDSLTQKEAEASSSRDSIEELTRNRSELMSRIKNLENDVAVLGKENSEQVVDLQKEIKLLREEKDETSKKFAEELQNLQSNLSTVSQELDAKKSVLCEKETYITSLSQEVKKANDEVSALRIDVAKITEKCATLSTEKAYSLDDIKLKQEQILNLEQEIKKLTNAFKEAEELLQQKEKDLSNSLGSIDELTQCNTEMVEKVKDLEGNVASLSKETSERVDDLLNEIQSLKEEKEIASKKSEEELQHLLAKHCCVSQELEIKKSLITNKDSQIASLTQELKEKIFEYSSGQSDLEDMKEKHDALSHERALLESEVKAKEELICKVEAMLHDTEETLSLKEKEISVKENEIEKTRILLESKEEANAQLLAKLQLAEQNVEMLNKDSSEHVMTLQNELSKLKDESVKRETSLQQSVAQFERDNEKLSKDLAEKIRDIEDKSNAISERERTIKTKEESVLELSCKTEQLERNIAELVKEKEELKKSLEGTIQTQKEQLTLQIDKKDADIAGMQTEKEELRLQLSEKTLALETEAATLSTLQTQLQEKDAEVASFRITSEKLRGELNEVLQELENSKTVHEKELVAREALEIQLRTLEETLKTNDAQALETNGIIENKTKECQQKEDECLALKAVLQEKEAQFDELSHLIEASEAQLIKLGEQNANNVKLLESKESYFNDFKDKKEKQIMESQEKFKIEILKLQDSLQKYEVSAQEKESLISKLNEEAEEQKAQLEKLLNELSKSKELNEKTLLNNGETHKEFVKRISELEEKCSQLLEEKKQIEEEKTQAKGAQKNLEEVRDTLLHEKARQEEVVRDRESQLATLQTEVNRMQTEFALHKQELQKKLDVSEMELQATRELKNQLDLQQNVLEELQQELINSEDKCKSLESQLKDVSLLSTEKAQLINKLTELEKSHKEKSDQIANMSEEYETLQELFTNDQNLLIEKEIECSSLTEKLQLFLSDEDSKEVLRSSLNSLEKENDALKQKIKLLEAKNANIAVETKNIHSNQMDSDERESLISQVDFLNSIIVDMKRKNEQLQQEVETLRLGPQEELYPNLNDTPKQRPPRLFCDICDMFDLHDTDDCPKQESFIADEGTPALIPQGARKMEERPYCNNCEVFGHWTLECDEQETY